MTDVKKIGFGRIESPLPEIKTVKIRHTEPYTQDCISSLASDPNRKITGLELYTKFAAAGVVGIIPFTASKIGQVIVKATATLATPFAVSGSLISTIFSFFWKATPPPFPFVLGWICITPIRILLGISAAIGGTLLFGGAIGFSKSQALVWGQELIKHPQEERVNTRLARYGASEEPYRKFKDLLELFFWPPDSLAYDHFPISDGLSYFRKFQVR